MTARCFFCGEPAAAGEDPRSALCDEHQAIHRHVVSIQTATPPARYAAVCKCGWRIESETYAGREDAVEAHWRSAIEEAAR